MKNISPIIICGMHRSGTTLLAELLMNKGVYLGNKLDTNLESIYFQRINRWLLSCIGSSWDNPRSFNQINDKEVEILTNRILNVLNNRFSNSIYFGPTNIIKNNKFFNYQRIWGWKDPVNVFTLLIWKEIFPNLKVINIIRHPLDVSNSLLIRQRKLSKIDKHSIYSNFISSFLPVLSINKGDVLSSLSIKNIDDCIILYKKYFKQMKQNSKIFSNIINIKYEDLLKNSKGVINEINSFCNLDINDYDCTIIDTKNLNKYNYNNLIYNKRLLQDFTYDLNE